MKTRFFTAWSFLVVVGLVAAFAVAPARTALAESGLARGHVFNVTFTKWITAFPDMTGVGGGAIGPAAFTGEILTLDVVGSMEYVHATYHLKGSKHAFTADIYVTQDDVAGSGVITGRVTEGWLKGAAVTGEYNIYPTCPIGTPGNGMGTLCFSGVLHLVRGP